MAKTANYQRDRVVFFDNLRVTLVVCVVLQHAANGYIGLDWWPVNEKDISVIVDFLAGFLDVFTMPLLFYIAGYFAVSTIRHKGVARFVNGKLKRLGLPWLVICLTICPILPLVYHYTRNGSTLTMGYGELWLELHKKAAKLDIEIIPSMNTLMMNNQYYQRYMWFLSVLIPFFIIFALLYGLKRHWFLPSSRQVESSARSALSTLGFMLSISLVTSILSFGVIGLMFALSPGLKNPEPLFTLGNVIQFRPSRLPIFVVYFYLGIMTYKHRWIERGRFPGHAKTWMVVFALLLIPFLFARYQVRFGPDHLKKPFGALFFLLLNFLSAASLGLFTTLAIRYWKHATPLSRIMAANSYYLYLSHYLFVIAYQLLLHISCNTAGLVKFLIVSALSFVSAFVTSQYFIRPYPRVSVFASIVLLVAMVVFIRP